MKKLYKYDGPVFLYAGIYKRGCVYYVHASSVSQAITMLNSKKNGQVRKEFGRTDIKAKVKYIKEEVK